MSNGLATTFEVLARTDNEAAVRVLVAALDSPDADIRQRAVEAILVRRRTGAGLEILRRLDRFGARERAIIARHHNRLGRALRDARAEVSALWSKLQSLRTRVDRLAGSVLPSLDENQRLSAKAYEAGEIGLVELLLVNRQTLDARRELLEAEAELRLVQAELARAAGIPSLSGR